MEINKNFEERFVGNGAFGEVYELVGHTPPAVIKYVKCEEESEIRTFRNESDILQRISHPNVVSFISTKEVPGSARFGIILGYCQRGTLKNLLFNPKIIYTMKTVLRWGEQLFDALSHIFDNHSVVHRNLKPENIFVTRDFLLKIGGLGLFKTIEQTCSGTFVGTLRYKSPPSFDKTQEIEEQFRMLLQDSHRNDVYSLGLVMWEIIERRLVFTDYGDGSFNRDLFLTDIFLKRLVGLELPNCQPEIQKIISRCTNFERQLRPTAREILRELKENKEIHDLFNDLTFCPMVDKYQEKLLKPIGYDKKLDTFEVDDSESESRFLELKQLIRQSKWDSFDPIEVEKFVKNYGKNRTQKSFKKIRHLFPDEEAQRKVELKKKSIDLLDDKISLQDVEEYLILKNIYLQCQNFKKFTNILEYIRIPTLSPWSKYQTVSQVMDVFEEFRMKSFMASVCLKCYTKQFDEKWLLIDQHLKRFIKDDLTEVHDFTDKQLIDEHEDILEVKSGVSLRYCREDLPIDFLKINECLRRILTNIETIGKFMLRKHRRLEDSQNILIDSQFESHSPIAGYVFQLRNPPRPSCDHKTKCFIQRYNPFKKIYENSELKFYPYSTFHMQIIHYECISEECRIYLELYFYYLQLFQQELLESRFQNLFEKKKEFQLPFGLKVDYFVFLNCKVFKSFSQQQFLILLDHPNNYQTGEKIPCLADGLIVYEVDVGVVKQYFEKTPSNQKTYTAISIDFKAKIRRFDGERYIDSSIWLDLKKKSTWSEMLRLALIDEEEFNKPGGKERGKNVIFHTGIDPPSVNITERSMTKFLSTTQHREQPGYLPNESSGFSKKFSSTRQYGPRGYSTPEGGNNVNVAAGIDPPLVYMTADPIENVPEGAKANKRKA